MNNQDTVQQDNSIQSTPNKDEDLFGDFNEGDQAKQIEVSAMNIYAIQVQIPDENQQYDNANENINQDDDLFGEDSQENQGQQQKQKENYEQNINNDEQNENPIQKNNKDIISQQEIERLRQEYGQDDTIQKQYENKQQDADNINHNSHDQAESNLGRGENIKQLFQPKLNCEGEKEEEKNINLEDLNKSNVQQKQCNDNLGPNQISQYNCNNVEQYDEKINISVSNRPDQEQNQQVQQDDQEDLFGTTNEIINDSHPTLSIQLKQESLKGNKAAKQSPKAQSMIPNFDDIKNNNNNNNGEGDDLFGEFDEQSPKQNSCNGKNKQVQQQEQQDNKQEQLQDTENHDSQEQQQLGYFQTQDNDKISSSITPTTTLSPKQANKQDEVDEEFEEFEQIEINPNHENEPQNKLNNQMNGEQDDDGFEDFEEISTTQVKSLNSNANSTKQTNNSSSNDFKKPQDEEEEEGFTDFEEQKNPKDGQARKNEESEFVIFI